MTIHFLLTPDSSSALAFKRLVAERKPGLGVIVGTWSELLELASNSFLLLQEEDEWKKRLNAFLMTFPESFWHASLLAIPAEAQSIASIIERNLTILLEGECPQCDLDNTAQDYLSDRATRHINDLAKLHRAMGRVLPPHLSRINRILSSPPELQIRHIHIYHRPQWPELNPWQQSLIEFLNKSSPQDDRFAELINQYVMVPTAPETSALGVAQRHIFDSPGAMAKYDNSLQCLAVRDHLQEAEITAGMVQQALRQNPDLRQADFGLLLPNDRRYQNAVQEIFVRAGLPLSGLRPDNGPRDIGNETVHLLLLCMDKPAPVMALASLFTSPLMPWDMHRGNALAQEIMDGRFDLKEWRDCGDGARTILTALRKPPATGTELTLVLKKIAKLLNPDELLEPHRSRAISTITRVIEALRDTKGDISWSELHSLCTSESLPSASPPPTREGIAVFHEGEEPWRRLRRLWVLGCSDGHYPSPVAHSALFSANELEELRNSGGLAIETPQMQSQRLRTIFTRQLCAASDSTTFLIPRRDPLGKPQAPSAAITFLASLFTDNNGKPLEHETMIIELEAVRGREQARDIALAPDAAPALPREPVAQDLHFHKNLLELNIREDGTLKPESPSRLETLMVSPLAWLFERLGISARDWAPETLDVMTRGTLAHAVFEHLFTSGQSVPGPEKIEADVPDLLTRAIQSTCPFLQRDEWMVEREQLNQEILKAALRWAEILKEIKSKVLATEIGLHGWLDDVPIHGNADLLLALPGKRLYVADYKKSGSGSRWKRMNRGYDHQTALYRMMIKTGGLKRPEKAPEGLPEKLAEYCNSGEIGAMYYLLNDRNVLTDTTNWLPKGIGGVQEMGDTISLAALELIRSRFVDLKAGKIELNHEEDEKEFKNKRGIGLYALDSSPLVRMFMKKGDRENSDE